MKRFLSIDWDFFVDATAVQRALLFPDGGNENWQTDLRKFIWDSRYRDPDLEKIGVNKETYDGLITICKDFYGRCFVADSHRHAYDFIMEHTFFDEEFEVYNIDFHHDLYNYRSADERVNCGNWGTILREDRPNMKYVWVKCEDSDTMTIGDVEVDVDTIDFKEFSKLFLNKTGRGIGSHFDHLYLCRSAMWSPPHLDEFFIKAAKLLIKHCPTVFEQEIDKPRPYEIPTDFTEYAVLDKIIRGDNN